VRIETHERDPWTIEADPRIKLATARLDRVNADAISAHWFALNFNG
jgi:hypothetical protein